MLAAWVGNRCPAPLRAKALGSLQAAMRAKTKLNKNTKQDQRRWRDSTINRFFAYLRRVFTLAIKDNKLARNPVSGVTFFPESNRTRFLTDEELTRLKNVLSSEKSAIQQLPLWEKVESKLML